MENATRIAKIKSTHLGTESHGIMTANLELDFGGSGVIAGGYCLDSPLHVERDGEKKFLGRYGTAFGMEFVTRTLRACGVDSWEKVAGRTVLAILDSEKDEWGARVIGLRPLPTEKGKEFRWDTLADELIELGLEKKND